MSQIQIKKKRCKGCETDQYIWARGMCRKCVAKLSQPKKINTVRQIGSKGSGDLQDLIDDLDAVYSRYLRIKYADSNGIVECYTCGEKSHYTTQDCGHLFSRKHLILRWDCNNTRVQCKKCNQLLDGNIKIFKERLEAEMPNIIEYLYSQSNLVLKPTRDELKELIIEYRYKLKLVETKLN